MLTMMMMMVMVMMIMMSAATVLGSSVATENYPPGTFRGVFGWLEGVLGVGFQTGEHSVVNFAQRGTDKTFLSNLHPLRCHSADGPGRAAVLYRSKSLIKIIGV